MPNATRLGYCRNGHKFSDVGVYVINHHKWGPSERCKKCHLDSIERSRKALRAKREHREQLLPNEVPRFLAKIQPLPSGCWEWTGALHGANYGIIQIAGRARLAHRVSYRFHFGQLDDDLDIDHLCRNPKCVNPEHLEPVSHAENVARGTAPTAAATRRAIDSGVEYTARKVGPQLIHS